MSIGTLQKPVTETSVTKKKNMLRFILVKNLLSSTLWKRERIALSKPFGKKSTFQTIAQNKYPDWYVHSNITHFTKLHKKYSIKFRTKYFNINLAN